MGCCCCHPDGCLNNGCFSHASFLCLGWEFGASRSVCECTVPCFSYLKAPGISRTEVCCYAFTKVSNPDSPPDTNVPLDIQCMSNLYVCSFAFGQYLPRTLECAMTVPGRTLTSPPQVQKVTASPPPPKKPTKTVARTSVPGVGKGAATPTG